MNGEVCHIADVSVQVMHIGWPSSSFSLLNRTSQMRVYEHFQRNGFAMK